MTGLPKRDRARRLRVLIVRRAPGYAFYDEHNRLLRRVYYSIPRIEHKMGPKKPAQWWSAMINPKHPFFKLLQPLNRIVDEQLVKTRQRSTDKESSDGISIE